MDGFLFDLGESAALPPSENRPAGGQPRLRVPQRDQIQFREAALDHLLDPDHAARLVWAAVCRLDLSRWLGQIRAVEGTTGRDATDPRLLVALWVYATLDAVGSAREIERLCRQHVAYQWLCGGVSVNHHLLSDFRSQNLEGWDELLTQIVAGLLAEDLVTMKRVAQDGMRVRAHAGKSSFRRQSSLQQCLADAQEQVEALKRLADESTDELTKRQRAARERAAAERAQRVEAAVRHCDELQQQRKKRAKKANQPAKESRASTTDPEARTMQFSDGGYRPGFNVQFSTDTATGLIVGTTVVNAGNDAEQLPLMLDQLQLRYGRRPAEALVDGGFASLDAIEQADSHGCLVYAPLKDEAKQRLAGTDPCARKKGDTDAVAAWRTRMGTDSAKTIYQLRCQTAEWVNAIVRNRGLQQMPVRGLQKCRAIALLHAIAHNVLVASRIRRPTTAIR